MNIFTAEHNGKRLRCIGINENDQDDLCLWIIVFSSLLEKVTFPQPTKDSLTREIEDAASLISQLENPN